MEHTEPAQTRCPNVLNTQRKYLDTLEDREGRERAQRRPDISTRGLTAHAMDPKVSPKLRPRYKDGMVRESRQLQDFMLNSLRAWGKRPLVIPSNLPLSTTTPGVLESRLDGL